jgi:hypothetical protein
MRNLNIEWEEELQSEVMIEFGTARLVERPNGQLEIEGGFGFDRCRAREWAAHFLDVRLPVEV